MKHAELVIFGGFEAGMAITLVNMMEEAGYSTRVTVQRVYSYQGGDHVAAEKWPHERPEDWSTGGMVAWTKGDGATEYHAHPGDILVLVGIEDRYGYAKARGLKVVRLCPETCEAPGQPAVRAADRPDPMEAYRQLKNWIETGELPEPVDSEAG